MPLCHHLPSISLPWRLGPIPFSLLTFFLVFGHPLLALSTSPSAFSYHFLFSPFLPLDGDDLLQSLSPSLLLLPRSIGIRVPALLIVLWLPVHIGDIPVQAPSHVVVVLVSPVPSSVIIASVVCTHLQHVPDLVDDTSWRSILHRQSQDMNSPA